MNGYLIVSFDQNWIKIFNEIPTFDVSIDENGKLNLCSTKSVHKIKNPPTNQLQEITK